MAIFYHGKKIPENLLYENLLYLDGVDISKLGLTDLRSNIAVIPQGQIQNMSGLHRCRRVHRISPVGGGVVKSGPCFTSSFPESGLPPQGGEKCVFLHIVDKFVKMSNV